MMVFSEKNIEYNKCEKVDFLQIRHFFIAEMGKLPVKAEPNRELTDPPKPLVTIVELHYEFRQHQKWPLKQKNVILTPVICVT